MLRLRVSAAAACVLLVVGMLVSLSAPTPASAATKKKSQAEWSKELAGDEKLGQMLFKEHEMDNAVLGELKVDAPALVYVHFPRGVDLKKHELDALATRWMGMLQSAAVRVSMWGAGKGSMLCTAYREKDVPQVVEFLLQQPEVMRVNYQYRDWWVLPKYQKEMEEHNRREAKRREDERRQMEEEARKHREREQQEAGKKQEL